jgi:hypothetical protein
VSPSQGGYWLSREIGSLVAGVAGMPWIVALLMAGSSQMAAGLRHMLKPRMG